MCITDLSIETTKPASYGRRAMNGGSIVAYLNRRGFAQVHTTLPVT